jgi:hypothetical protein
MRLFKIENWEVKIEDAVWALEPFKAILKRDKTKGKEKAFKEMAFIYFYTDTTSDFMYITNDKEREEEVRKSVGLPDKWEMDTVVKAAVDFYLEKSVTPIQELYKASIEAVHGVKNYLKRTDILLTERDDANRPITKPGDITRALKDVKIIMQDLKAAEKEVLKEKEDKEGRKKGSKEFGMFEDGL